MTPEAKLLIYRLLPFHFMPWISLLGRRYNGRGGQRCVWRVALLVSGRKRFESSGCRRCNKFFHIFRRDLQRWSPYTGRQLPLWIHRGRWCCPDLDRRRWVACSASPRNSASAWQQSWSLQSLPQRWLVVVLFLILPGRVSLRW